MQLCLACVNQPKVLVTFENYDQDNIYVDRVTRQTGRGSITGDGKYRGQAMMEYLSMACC
jgi:ribosomal protein S24E